MDLDRTSRAVDDAGGRDARQPAQCRLDSAKVDLFA
jgi:hypothetical protein